MKETSSSLQRWVVFGLCAAMFTMSNFWRVSNAVIAGDLSRDLGLTPESLGLLGGAFFYSFGLAQLPMGPLLDRLGGRTVISLLACFGAASALVFAQAGDSTTAVLARMGMGIGMAAALMGAYKVFAGWFSPLEFATLSGTIIAIGSLGAIGATTPLVWLSETFGWRGACRLMAVVTFLLAITFYLVVKDRPDGRKSATAGTAPAGGSLFSGLRAIFGSGLFWRMAPLSFTAYGGTVAAQGLWGGPYLIDTFGMGRAEASQILLAIPVGVVCGAPLWGYVSDRLGRRKPPVVIGIALMLIVFSSLVVGMELPKWGMIIQFWLLGFTGISNSLLYTQVKETFPPLIVGTALTALNFFVIMGAAALQHLMGLIMANWQPLATGALPAEAYRWGFGACVLLLALAFCLYFTSRETGSGSL